MLYHRENRIRLTSVIVSYGCVLYLLALGCFTLYPDAAGRGGHTARRTIWLRSSIRCGSSATSEPTA